VRNIAREILQVVGPRAADDDEVIQEEICRRELSGGDTDASARLRAQPSILNYKLRGKPLRGHG
jgi:hypothetical protein